MPRDRYPEVSKGIRSREDTARFIEKQFDGETDARKRKGNAIHYGAAELRELMDFIYQEPPSRHAEKFDVSTKGWK